MNNIIFVYSDNSEKGDIALSEDAIKAVLRKFRKTAAFSQVQLDLSPSCREAMKESLAGKAENRSLIIWFGKKEKTTDEEAFAQECFGASVKQYCFGNKSIFTPFSHRNITENTESVCLVAKTPVLNIQRAVKLATNAANERSGKILLCTDTESPYDASICREFENFLSDTRSFTVDYYDFDELMYILTREIPSCDSILCSEDKAHLIATNINCLNRFPLGYTVWHCENTKIFKREFLPFENQSNILYASMLIAASNMLAKEPGLTSAGIHLKKAVTLTLEKCFSEKRDEFHKHLLFEINSPIRNRQVNKNDSDN